MPTRATPPASVLGLLLLLGLVLRLGAAASGLVISRDGITYLDLAARALGGDASGALRGSHYPPVYPALLALGGAAAGGVSEVSAHVITALVSALAIPAVALLAGGAFGRSAGVWAGFIVAVSPLACELGGELLADGPFVTLVAGSLLLGHRALEAPAALRAGPPAAGAGLLAGAAYLTRPEGLLVLGVLLVALALGPRRAEASGARRRLVDPLCLLVPCVLAAAPYVLFLRDQPVLGGGLVGVFKLTGKRDLLAHVAAASPGSVLRTGLEQARHVGKALLPALPFVLALLALRVPRAQRGVAVRLGVPLVLLGAGLLLGYAFVRADRRFAAPFIVLAAPFAGAGAARLVLWLRARAPRPAFALALALLAACLPVVLRDRHRSKVTWREAGAVLRAAGARRVLAEDSRAAYYAGAVAVGGVRMVTDAPTTPGALHDLAEAEGADAVIVVVKDDDDARLSAGLDARVGRPPVRVRRPGAEPLDVFLLGRP